MRRSRAIPFLTAGIATLIALGSCSEARTAPPASVSAEPAAMPASAPVAPSAPPVQADAADPAPGASDTAIAPVAPPAGEPRRYTIIGTGDIMMGSDWPEPGFDPRIVPGADPAVVTGAPLVELFAQADVVFGNYEGTIHGSDEDAKECRNPEFCFVFRSPPFHADYLRRAGYSLMSNANNHARDFGESGRRATYAALTGAGIAVAGGDVEGMRIAVQTLDDGRRVGLVAFGHNPGLLSVQDYARVGAMVRAAEARADIVIVSCHIGAEGSAYSQVTRATEMFLDEDRGNPYRFAHEAIDAGADAVFCHGPHIPRAVEVYRGRFIAYSLGNFWTYGRFNLRGDSGLAPIARLEVDGDGALLAAQIVSARQERPGGPVLDPRGEAARRIAFLTARDFPESGTQVDSAGRISWPH